MHLKIYFQVTHLNYSSLITRLLLKHENLWEHCCRFQVHGVCPADVRQPLTVQGTTKVRVTVTIRENSRKVISKWRERCWNFTYWHRISLEGYLRVEKNGKNCTWHHTVRYSKLVRNVQIAKLIIFFLISRYQGSHHSINGEDHRQETDELDLQTQNNISFKGNWIRRAFSRQLPAK